MLENERPTKGVVVDCGCRKNPGVAEYKGVDLETGKIIFEYKLNGISTNNIAEFLAAVHGIAYLKKNNIKEKVYSDSLTAIAWVRDRRCKTNFKVENYQQIEIIHRAEQYLCDNGGIAYFWSNIRWGENPADYGRKTKGSYTENKYKFLKK